MDVDLNMDSVRRMLDAANGFHRRPKASNQEAMQAASDAKTDRSDATIVVVDGDCAPRSVAVVSEFFLKKKITEGRTYKTVGQPVATTHGYVAATAAYAKSAAADSLLHDADLVSAIAREYRPIEEVSVTSDRMLGPTPGSGARFSHSVSLVNGVHPVNDEHAATRSQSRHTASQIREDNDEHIDGRHYLHENGEPAGHEELASDRSQSLPGVNEAQTADNELSSIGSLSQLRRDGAKTESNSLSIELSRSRFHVSEVQTIEEKRTGDGSALGNRSDEAVGDGDSPVDDRSRSNSGVRELRAISDGLTGDQSGHRSERRAAEEKRPGFQSLSLLDDASDSRAHDNEPAGNRPQSQIYATTTRLDAERLESDRSRASSAAAEEAARVEQRERSARGARATAEQLARDQSRAFASEAPEVAEEQAGQQSRFCGTKVRAAGDATASDRSPSATEARADIWKLAGERTPSRADPAVSGADGEQSAEDPWRHRPQYFLEEAGLDDGDRDNPAYANLPPSFVVASDESTDALWKAVDAFKQVSVPATRSVCGRSALEMALRKDKLLLGCFSDSSRSGRGASVRSEYGSQRRDERSSRTMRTTTNGWASYGSDVEGAARCRRGQSSTGAFLAVTVRTSGSLSGGGGGGGGMPAEGSRDSLSAGDGVAQEAFRRSGQQYASFRQIRPPAVTDVKRSTTLSTTTTSTRQMSSSTTTTMNIYQLSILPVCGSQTKEADAGSSNVLKNYTKGRPFVTYWIRLLIRDIKFDNAANLLISTKSAVVMFDVNGHQLGEVFKESIAEPYGLFVCENNNVLVADCKRNVVCEFDVTGRVLQTYGPVAAPAGVAKGRDGRVYVCSRWNRLPPCIVVFSPKGDVLGRIGDEYLDNPVSISLRGSLLAVTDGFYLVGIDRRGQVQFVYGQEPASWESANPPPAASVAIDVEGYILVTDYSMNSLCGMTPDVDQAGIVLGEANECKRPFLVATSRYGHLAVVERHDNGYKVKLYKRNDKALKVKP